MAQSLPPVVKQVPVGEISRVFTELSFSWKVHRFCPVSVCHPETNPDADAAIIVFGRTGCHRIAVMGDAVLTASILYINREVPKDLTYTFPLKQPIAI
jgi:hypothetical protein